MTTFLQLYTEPPTRRVFALHRPGRLILASDEITREDLAVYDECIQLPPPAELAATLEILRSVRADHVVAQTEYGLLLGALLNGLDREAAFLCTNKWLCRQALAAAAVRVPRFALVEDAAQVRAFAEQFPIVLKPVASTLARGVTFVDAARDVDTRVDELRAKLPTLLDVERCIAFAELAKLDLGCDPRRQFLVEDFADGPALETDGLVFGDQVVCFGTTEQVVATPPHLAIEGYMFPADNADLTDVTMRALSACKVRDMGFSVEFRGPTVIEVNGRLGEDDGFPDLFEKALGEYPILKWLARDARVVAPRFCAAIAYRNDYSGGAVHVAHALATHPTSSRAAYQVAHARLV